MTNLYFHNEDIKNKIIRPLKGSKIENYFIINKKWMDKLIEKFKYNKFYEIIKSKRDEILNINENFQLCFEGKVSDEFLEKIIKLIENEDFINDILKDEKLLEGLSNKELYSVNMDNIEDSTNNLSIINEKIKNLIKEIFKIECEEKKELILGNDKIISKIKAKGKNYIIEGKLITFDCNYSFIKENSINFNRDKNNMDECFINYIKIGNEKGNQCDKNVKKEYLNNGIKKEEIKLEEFTKKQIKILILYYLFIEELKENIELSKTSYECYLIHKNYMKEYKNFYLYNELVQEIQKILLSNNNIRNNSINKEEIIFNNLNNEYLKKIENKYPKDIVDNKEIARFKKKQNLQYPFSFEIINKNIYEMIKKRKDNKVFNFGKKEYLIDEDKIILKLDYPNKNIYEIIVGAIDKINNTFISNYLYKFKEISKMITHYDYLTRRTFTMFKLYNISQTNQKVLLEDINNNNEEKKTRRIYILNEIKEKQNDNNSAQKLLSNEKIIK